MADYTGSEIWSIFAMQGFTGLSLFCVFLLMALGLAIIFGQMGVINMAHGEFLTIGAYTTVMLSKVAGRNCTHPPCSTTCSSWPPSSVSCSPSLRAGYLVEMGLIRHLYKRPLDTLLATWGLSLIMQQTFRSTFGAREVSPALPGWLLGSLH
ncbi:MAG: hypothetical protein MPW15_15360 [Candidatus Manganitrophus sp.]|nr:hypothetical protein [Candidatus Manganitrophus sp.]